jgi:hypothetical protein
LDNAPPRRWGLSYGFGTRFALCRPMTGSIGPRAMVKIPADKLSAAILRREIR